MANSFCPDSQTVAKTDFQPDASRYKKITRYSILIAIRNNYF